MNCGRDHTRGLSSCFCSNMNPRRLHEYLPRNFDAQLEAYLLTDSERRDWSETKVNLGLIYTSGSKVIPSDVNLNKSWLVIKVEVAKTLVDGEEVIFNMFRWADGHLKQAALVRIQKQGEDEAHLIYREPVVVLEKLGGNFIMSKGCKFSIIIILSNLEKVTYPDHKVKPQKRKGAQSKNSGFELE